MLSSAHIPRRSDLIQLILIQLTPLLFNSRVRSNQIENDEIRRIESAKGDTQRRNNIHHHYLYFTKQTHNQLVTRKATAAN